MRGAVIECALLLGALMAVVTVELAIACLRTPLAMAIFAVASVLVLRWKVNAAWLVLGGALTGWLLG